MTSENYDPSDTYKEINDENESLIKKPKYPFYVFTIVGSEFVERFNYYAMKSVLALYLTRKLMYTDDTGTIFFHLFIAAVYFFCIFGGILADSWWGRFNSIVMFSVIYLCGNTILSLGAVQTWHMPAKTLTFIGLLLIALGSGGIKPCVSTIAGEQFKVPEQAKQLTTFFAVFHFSINIGSFLSTVITPILREDVKCLGMDDCFPAAFVLPAILMFIAVVVFLSAKFKYILLPIQGNMMVKVCKCIWYAIRTRHSQSSLNPKKHWLEYAEGKFGRKLVMETKILLNVLVLYLPFPLFWALFEQQGSRWTFQATRMDGDLGFVVIKADQMLVIGPTLFLMFIPLFQSFCYPAMAKIGISRPLQKMTLAGFLAGISFLCSMVVEMKIEPTYPVLPKAGFSQFRMYNAKSYEVSVNMYANGHAKSFKILPNDFYQNLSIPINGTAQKVSFVISEKSKFSYFDGTLSSGKADSFLITGRVEDKLIIKPFLDDPDKSRPGKPIVRFLANIDPKSQIKMRNSYGFQYNENSNYSERRVVEHGVYDILVNDDVALSNVKLRHGGVYAILMHNRNEKGYAVKVDIVTEPNSICILWLIPQYVLMAVAETMFRVNGLQFSFTQAPESMRSVIRGCWLLMFAIGNLFVAIIVGARIFHSQVYEFLLFAVLIFIDMIIFMWLGVRYKSTSLDEIKNAEEDDDENILTD